MVDPRYTPYLREAEAAVEYAQSVRTFHRKRTKRDSTQRRTDIEVALARLKKAMGPLRSELGRFAYERQGQIVEESRSAIREASAAIQAERRKLWKMKRSPRVDD